MSITSSNLKIVAFSFLFLFSASLFAGGSRSSRLTQKDMDMLDGKSHQREMVAPQTEAISVEASAETSNHSSPMAMMVLILGIAGVFLFPVVSEFFANKMLEGKITYE